MQYMYCIRHWECNSSHINIAEKVGFYASPHILQNAVTVW